MYVTKTFWKKFKCYFPFVRLLEWFRCYTIASSSYFLTAGNTYIFHVRISTRTRRLIRKLTTLVFATSPSLFPRPFSLCFPYSSNTTSRIRLGTISSLKKKLTFTYVTRSIIVIRVNYVDTYVQTPHDHRFSN